MGSVRRSLWVRLSSTTLSGRHFTLKWSEIKARLFTAVHALGRRFFCLVSEAGGKHRVWRTSVFTPAGAFQRSSGTDTKHQSHRAHRRRNHAPAFHQVEPNLRYPI